VTRLLVSTGKGVLCRVDEHPVPLGFFECWPDFVELHVAAPASALPPPGETIVDLDALPSYAPTQAQLVRALRSERLPSERERTVRALRHQEVAAFRAWHTAYGRWMDVRQAPDDIIARAVRWQRWRGVALYALALDKVRAELPPFLQDVVPNRIETIEEAQIRAATLTRELAPQLARLERRVVQAHAHWEAVRYRESGRLIAA
jgi:hypothetical protein